MRAAIPEKSMARRGALRPGPSRTGGTSLRSLLAVAFAAVVVLAALAAHSLRQSGPAEGGVPPSGGADLAAGRTGLPTSAPSPSELLADPMGAAGVEPLSELPPEAVLPPDSVREYAFRRPLPDGSEYLLLRCLAPVSASEAAEFYETEMARRGYDLVKDSSEPDTNGTARRLVFRRAEQVCTVVIRSTDRGRQARVFLAIWPGGRPAHGPAG